ncbi:MAG TPA: RodZ domain-containing protein [Sphingobium sp.]|uniref:helix-turn-helix domain-containing protein n=1 Tax=Sphingobium sp. TaxID=1912891 RepID=UPI002ED01FE3
MESETDGQVQPVAAAASAQMLAAREAAGLSLADVASRTRVPLRHLEALERGDYAALPGITYCAGFARAYARAVGLDEKALVAKVREEVDQTGDFTEQYQVYEPADPARVPPRFLAWFAAIVAILLAGGYGLWRMQINTPPVESVATVETPEAARPGPQRAAPVQQPAPSGPVVLTAVEDVWLRIYDADGKTILQKTLPKGESFTVPADANNPMILTGRADALAVTVGGRPVPPLGTAERTISDVPISAQALMARGTAGAANAASPAVPVAADAPQSQGGSTPAATTAHATPTAPVAQQRPAAFQSVQPAGAARNIRPVAVTRPATPASPQRSAPPVTHAPPGVLAPTPSAAPEPSAGTSAPAQ